MTLLMTFSEDKQERKREKEIPFHGISQKKMSKKVLHEKTSSWFSEGEDRKKDIVFISCKQQSLGSRQSFVPWSYPMMKDYTSLPTNT